MKVITKVEKKEEREDLGEEPSSRLFRRIIGFMFVLYGFFSFVAPDMYGFGDLPSEYTQALGLFFVTIGLFLIMRRRGILG